jgi:hypothetical protein
MKVYGDLLNDQATTKVAKYPPRRQNIRPKTEQRGNRRPSIRQRSDGGGKASAKTTTVAKHPLVKHKTAAKHPLSRPQSQT